MHGGDFILEVGGGDWASHMMEHELGGCLMWHMVQDLRQSGESGLWKNTMAK